MAELASGLAGKVLGLLASSAYEEIKRAWGVKDELEKLRRTMASIRAVLLDAEEKQVHNRAITLWLADLKSGLYDVEDILADFQAQHLRSKVLGLSRWSFSKKVSRFFLHSSNNPILFKFRMAHRVREIHEKLGEIAEIKKDFGLVERDEQPPQGSNREREMTYSYVHAPDIVGREEAKITIIKYLDQRVCGGGVSVIPIIRMGGLGKTALTKLVYNDDWVKENFEIKLWVCVSDDFNLKKVMIQTIKSATGKDLGNMDVDQLQQELRGILGGKRYLLVLDDVWEEDERKWREFKTILMGGADGSKVIVTTRSNKVASIFGTIEAPYKIDELPHEDCVKIFFRCAFAEGEQCQWLINNNLRKIGEEIVSKCKGVPLAVMTLGSLLRFKTDETEWKSVRDSEIWKLEQKENDIMPALRLSYERLPSHLKSCFACCSIFPKDYQLNNVGLTGLWMSLDLVKPSSNGWKSLEDVGRSYCNELASRGFFQDLEENIVGIIFRMHDLIHDLASSVSGDELFNIASNSSNKESFSPQRIRYLYSGNQPASPDIIPFLQGLDHIRTALFQSGTNISFVEICLLKFRYLRYFWLVEFDYDMLPKGIFSNSQHLRFLNISGNKKIRRLPSSICELHSLQFLNLGGCDSLEELPKNIKLLVSLRNLVLTLKQVRLPNNGIGSMKALQFLYLFCCENMEHLCQDIRGLKNLHELYIVRCPRLKCLPQGVKYLQALETLVIEDCKEFHFGLEDGEQNHDIASCGIRMLALGYLPKLEQIPQWLLQGSANTLQVLQIESCDNLKKFWNDLENLSALQSVRVENCPDEFHPGETEEDWRKISHIPSIMIDGELVSFKSSAADNDIKETNHKREVEFISSELPVGTRIQLNRNVFREMRKLRIFRLRND